MAESRAAYIERFQKLTEEMDRRWGAELHDIWDDPDDIHDPIYQRWIAGRADRELAKALDAVRQEATRDMDTCIEAFRGWAAAARARIQGRHMRPPEEQIDGPGLRP